MREGVDLEAVPNASRSRLARLAPVALVFVFAAWPELIAVPGDHGLLTPDGMEHVSIANAASQGQGFVNPVQWHFSVPGPPPLPAAATRPPTLPALLSLGLATGATLPTLFLAHALFAALVAVGMYLVGRRFMHPGPAAAATLLIVLTPTWALVRASLLSEMTAMAAYLLVVATARNAVRSWAGALLCAGATILAWLSRPNLAPLGLAVLVAAGWNLRRPGAFLRSPLVVYALALFAGMRIVSWGFTSQTGFAPYEAYGSFENFPAARALRYGNEYVGMPAFVQANLSSIFAACASHLRRLLSLLFLSPLFHWVGWLGLIGTASVLRAPSRATIEERMLVLSALGFGAIIVLTYPAFDPFRYPLFPATSAALAGMAVVDRLLVDCERRFAWLGSTPARALGWASLVVACLTVVVPQYVASSMPRKAVETRTGGPMDEICDALEPGRLVVTDVPWPVHWNCGNPAIRLPSDLRKPEIEERFFSEQEPHFLVSYRKPWTRWALQSDRTDFLSTNGETYAFEVVGRSPGKAPRPIRPPVCLLEPGRSGC